MDHTYIEEHLIVERYLQGKLSDEEAERFEEHYLGCRECLGHLEAAERLARGMRGVAAEDAAADATEETTEETTAMPAPAKTPPPSRTWQTWAMAAAVALLLMPTALLWHRVNRLGGELEQAHRPLINPPLLRLSPERSSPGATTPAHRLTFGPQPEWVVLDLDLGSATGSTFQAELRSAEGEIRWSAEELHANTLGTLTLGFYSSFLEPGDYTLTLEEIARDGQPGASHSFSLRVAREGSR